MFPMFQVLGLGFTEGPEPRQDGKPSSTPSDGGTGGQSPVKISQEGKYIGVDGEEITGAQLLSRLGRGREAERTMGERDSALRERDSYRSETEKLKAELEAERKKSQETQSQLRRSELNKRIYGEDTPMQGYPQQNPSQANRQPVNQRQQSNRFDWEDDDDPNQQPAPLPQQGRLPEGLTDYLANDVVTRADVDRYFDQRMQQYESEMKKRQDADRAFEREMSQVSLGMQESGVPREVATQLAEEIERQSILLAQARAVGDTQGYREAITNLTRISQVQQEEIVKAKAAADEEARHASMLPSIGSAGDLSSVLTLDEREAIENMTAEETAAYLRKKNEKKWASQRGQPR